MHSPGHGSPKNPPMRNSAAARPPGSGNPLVSVASYAPMRRARLAALLLAAAALAVSTGASGPPPSPSRPDPLADDISRWSRYLKENPSKDEDVDGAQGRDGARPGQGRGGHERRPVVPRAPAPRAGARRTSRRRSTWTRSRRRRAPTWRRSRPSGRASARRCRRTSARPSPQALAGVTPAAVRAVGEAALPQVRVFYDASLDYGHNTMADAGFFYLASARAQRDFVEFCRSLSRPVLRRSRRPRAGAALDRGPRSTRSRATSSSLYRPPASIDRHTDFIVASSTLKEARELDGWGLRYGALLRYLQAAMRIDALRTPGAGPRRAGARRARRRAPARLDAGGRDDSIGRIFLECRAGRRGPRRGRQEAGGRGRDRRRTCCRGTSRRSSRRSRGRRSRRPRSRSRSSAGRTPETSPIRQVCWLGAWSRGSAARRSSFPRTTATPRSRSGSA